MTKFLTVAAVMLLLVPVAATAQTPASEQSPTAQPPQQGPLVLERIQNPFVVAPDYRITDLDGNTGQLAGAYAGRLLDNTLFVGGGYYWLVNGGHEEEMRYGGFILGWSMPVGRAIRFGARGLVGVGTAELATGTDVRVPDPRVQDPRMRDHLNGVPGQTVRFLAHDDFFVFEPQANTTVNIIPHLGIEVGAGYRVTGSTEALEDRLNGISGSLALQLTW